MAIAAEQLHGGWHLREFTVTRLGQRVLPFGSQPAGLLLYTPDGWMSATILPGDDAESPHRSAICYAGRFYLEEQAGGTAVFHEVQAGILPFARGTVQRREAQLSDDGMTLTLRAQQTDYSDAVLVWQRATAEP